MYLALFTLPCSTFVCLALFGRFLGARGTIVLSVLGALSQAVLALCIFYEVALCASPCQITLGSFIVSGLMDGSWGFLFDALTTVMIAVVTLISCLVVIYSCSYMIGEAHFIRFISYLKFFTVAMLILVSADNFVQLFVGWELVGLASFLLISFWFTRLQASKAAIQAMLLNRVGDVGLALGIIGLFFTYKTTNYQGLFVSQEHSALALLPLLGMNLHDISCIFLFIGAMGKSGQFGLHAWLPNAMNAPTPVSALLHAATMVTAGVFLLARSSPLFSFSTSACIVVTIVGALTTIFAGTIGLVQNDFKSIVAYSTCSQLGYMVTVSGLCSYNVAMFHLFNHAFFKALLFLTAGAVIHGLANLQDIRKFGGLQQIFIFSYTCLLIGTLALVGTPFLTGFYSKDVILELAYTRFSLSANFSYLLTSFSVCTTAYYSFRLLFLTFFSTPITLLQKTTNLPKTNAKNAHDADVIMASVLIVLAVGSVFAGWFFKPMLIGLGGDFWNNSLITQNSHALKNAMIEAEFLPQAVKLLPLMATVTGFLLAYLFTLISVKRSYLNAAYRLRHVYLFLNQRWFFDKLLNESVAYRCYKLGFSFVKVFDKGLLETLPFFGLGLPRSLKILYIKLGATQSGLIYHYAILMIFTALISLTVLNIDNFPSVQLFSDARVAILMAATLSIL